MYSPPSSITSPEAIIGLATVMLVTATMAVALRVFVRKAQKMYMGPDDWIALLSYVAFLAMVICVYIGLSVKSLGYNAKVSTLDGAPDEIRATVTLLIQIFTNLTLGLARLSALFFFRRIFCSTKRATWFEVALYTLITLVSLWTVAFLIAPAAACGDHLYGLWTPQFFYPYCDASPEIIYVGSITDLIFEVLIVALPIPKILSLHVSLRRRLAVVFVFLTALVSVAGSAARMAILARLRSGPTADVALANTAVDFAWLLESGFAMVAINLPSLWYLRHKVAPEKVLQSMRSMLSLDSRSTRVSSHSRSTGPKKKGSSETYAMSSRAGSVPAKGDNEEPGLPPTGNSIQVTTAMSQWSEAA